MGVRLDPPALAVAVVSSPHSPTASGVHGAANGNASSDGAEDGDEHDGSVEGRASEGIEAMAVRQVTFDDGFAPSTTAFDVFDLLRQEGFFAGIASNAAQERQLMRLLDCLIKKRLPNTEAAGAASAGSAPPAAAGASLSPATAGAGAAPLPTNDVEDSYADSFAEQTSEDRSDLADAFF